MRLLKYQAAVIAVTLLFSTIKGFSSSNFYQEAFYNILMCGSASLAIAVVLSWCGVGPAARFGEEKAAVTLSVINIIIWCALLVVHLVLRGDCAEVNDCSALELKDFGVTGILWVMVPELFMILKVLRPSLKDQAHDGTKEAFQAIFLALLFLASCITLFMLLKNLPAPFKLFNEVLYAVAG